MSTEAGLHAKIIREMASFQKTMDELRLLRRVSRDLRMLKRMMGTKKFD